MIEPTIQERFEKKMFPKMNSLCMPIYAGWNVKVLTIIHADLRHGDKTETWGYYKYGDAFVDTGRGEDGPLPYSTEQLEKAMEMASRSFEREQEVFAKHLSIDYIIGMAHMHLDEGRNAAPLLIKVTHDDGRVSWTGITADEVVRRESFDYKLHRCSACGSPVHSGKRGLKEERKDRIQE